LKPWQALLFQTSFKAKSWEAPAKVAPSFLLKRDMEKIMLSKLQKGILADLEIIEEIDIDDYFSLLPEIVDILSELKKIEMGRIKCMSDDYKTRKKLKAKLKSRREQIKLVFNQLYLKGLVSGWHGKRDGWLTLTEDLEKHPEMNRNYFTGEPNTGSIIKSKDWNKLCNQQYAKGELVFVGSEACDCVWPNRIKKLTK